MADELHKAKMKIKQTGLCTIVEITAVGGHKLRDKYGYILKSYFPKTGQAVLPENTCNSRQ